MQFLCLILGLEPIIWLDVDVITACFIHILSKFYISRGLRRRWRGWRWSRNHNPRAMETPSRQIIGQIAIWSLFHWVTLMRVMDRERRLMLNLLLLLLSLLCLEQENGLDLLLKLKPLGPNLEGQHRRRHRRGNFRQ